MRRIWTWNINRKYRTCFLNMWRRRESESAPKIESKYPSERVCQIKCWNCDAKRPSIHAPQEKRRTSCNQLVHWSRGQEWNMPVLRLFRLIAKCSTSKTSMISLLGTADNRLINILNHHRFHPTINHTQPPPLLIFRKIVGVTHSRIRFQLTQE